MARINYVSNVYTIETLYVAKELALNAKIQDYIIHKIKGT